MFSSRDSSCWNCLEPVCPIFDVSSRYFWAVFSLVVMCLSLDMPFFVRSRYGYLMARYSRPIRPPPLLSTHVYSGLCLTTNMKFSNSMRSAAGFLKECDLSFQSFLCTSHLQDILQSLNGGITNTSNNLRFRKPVGFLHGYCIHTRLVWWDNSNLYLEQKLTCPDYRGTVCALNYSRQTVQGISVPELLHELPVCTCLPKAPPPEIESWLVCIKTVNQQLTLSSQW